MANLLDSHFRKTKVKPGSEIQFDPDMLKLFMAVDESKTLRQIAAELNLKPEIFKQNFAKLVKFKLIEEAENRRAFVDPGFLERAKSVLVDLVGPLGELLVEDAAQELNLALDRIPKTDVADLVYRIAQKIPGESEQGAFKKSMLEEMKLMGL